MKMNLLTRFAMDNALKKNRHDEVVLLVHGLGGTHPKNHRETCVNDGSY